MGHRANLIVVQYGKYELFYSHWAANTLTHDLFWSPEFATAFIRMQRKVDESYWLDEVWAEGGAVADWRIYPMEYTLKKDISQIVRLCMARLDNQMGI